MVCGEEDGVTDYRKWPEKVNIDGISIWACKHCGEPVLRWKEIAEYCYACAYLIIENLSEKTIEQIWKELEGDAP